MTKLTEFHVGEAALSWLEGLGWSVAHGTDIAPGELNAERTEYREVVLAARVRAAIQDLNPQLPRGRN